MKPLDSFYINNISFNKQYQFTSFTLFRNQGYMVQNYSSSQPWYISIDNTLKQYDTNVYKINTQSYYLITMSRQDIGTKILQSSVQLSCNGVIYIDNGNNILYKSGSSNNYGNIFYQAGMVVITSKNLIDDLDTYQ